MSGAEEPLCDDLGDLESCLGIDEGQRPAPHLFGRAKAWGAGFLAPRKKKINSLARRDPQDVIFSGSARDTPAESPALLPKRGGSEGKSLAAWEDVPAGATPWKSQACSSSKSVCGQALKPQAATFTLILGIYRGMAQGIASFCLFAM